MSVRALVAGTVVLFALSAHAFQNEPDGFRGLKWGDPPPPELVAGAAVGALTTYLRPGDKMIIGEASLSSTAYAFYKERFAGVIIDTKESSNGYALKGALEAQFGPGHRANPYIDYWAWSGSTARITLRCRLSMRECTAIFFSAALTLEQLRDQKEAAAKAKGDF